jgi:apolipoprotein N-acyltransferase
LAIVPLILSINTKTPFLKEPDLKIKLSSPHLPQNIKWNKNFLPSIIKNNLKQIKNAIKEKYDIIILSESIFPLYLDQDRNLMNLLKKLSKKITIVTGALSYKNDKVYNSTYYFVNGKVTIADKVFLVPFGEEVPLPKFIAKYVNKIFFDGASDYSTAKKPTDIKIKGYTFRNAICYEATREEMYENSPSYMIAISNNAWFTPSIEPNLQKLILRYLSRKYKVVIFHSANMGITTVIKG